MKTQLLRRLAKLHADPRCCVRDYRSAREALHRQEAFKEAVRVLATLGDPHRLAMVKLLQQYGVMCACDIEAAFDLAHSTVIHHLTLLTEAGIVEVSKAGKWSYYRLSSTLPAKLETIRQFIGTGKEEPVRCCCCTPVQERG
jgi:ArsR family transcriptional regulator